MTRLPRGICKVCKQEVRLRRDGTVAGHGGGGGMYNPKPWCEGSWEKGWTPESYYAKERANGEARSGGNR